MRMSLSPAALLIALIGWQLSYISLSEYRASSVFRRRVWIGTIRLPNEFSGIFETCGM